MSASWIETKDIQHCSPPACTYRRIESVKKRLFFTHQSLQYTQGMSATAQKALHGPLLKQALSIVSFRNLWLGQLFSQIGANMLLSILALRIYEVTRSNTAVSILFLTYGVPAVLFGMLSGVMIDHTDKRKVLAFCNISRALMIIPLFIFPDNLITVYGVMFLNSLVSQFYLPAEAPLIPRLIPEKLLLSANSLFSFTFFASIALGFILAGPVLKLTGASGSFLILLLLYVAAVWFVFQVPRQKEDVMGLINMLRKNRYVFINQLWTDMKKGIEFCLHHRHVLDALILLSSTQIVLAILGALGPGFADRILQIQVTDASVLILGPAVVGIVLGALWVGSYGEQYSMRRLTSVGLLSAGTLLVLIAVLVRLERTALFGYYLPANTALILSVFLFFLLGLANSLLDVPSNATIQRESDNDLKGRIYGILTALGGGIGIIPVVAGGILADVLGIGKVVLGLGLVITTYGIWRLKHI